MSSQTETAFEQERLFVLRSTQLLDSDPSENFDRVTRLASQLFNVPVALVSLIDADRQWFKSRVGLDATETCREDAFCDHAIRQTSVMVVPDATLDPRFAQNPLVTGETGIRFYAGAPLILQSGYALGSLCIIDREPRDFTLAQCRQLEDLAALVVAQIDLSRSVGRRDEITSLPNRAQLTEDLEDLCRRSHGEERALILVEAISHLDLQDAVRAVGIAPVEQAMADTARALQAISAPAAVYYTSIGRFAVLLPTGDRDEAQDTVRRLTQPLPQSFYRSGMLLELHLRAGLVFFGCQPDAASDALRKASTAVHQARRMERSWTLYETSSDETHRRAYALLRDIPRALNEEEFRLVYQPKFSVRAGRYEGVEALLRWTHNDLGNVPTGDFIPLVENTALIHPVTKWVLHAALRQLAQWRTEGLHLTMAVNVSSRNLEHPGFLQVVRDACARYDVAPALLQIECTENAALTGQTTLRVLAQARAAGFHVALDDFGVGYCNLATLHTLPAELLKIDQSLVRPITSDARARAVLQSMVELGHTLGYRLLAEGVETQDVFDLLVAMGMDQIQGYLLSRPLEADAVLAFMRAQSLTAVPANAA